MFEDMTYEAILNGMLGRVTSDVDKREGSVIYDALAPCAYQLAQTYYQLKHYMDLLFGDTAVGEYLDRVVADYGITRKAATYAVRKIVTAGKAELGTRWGIGDTSYRITDKETDDSYIAVCEQAGSVGNIYTGSLENIDNVAGVSAELADIITAGEEEETDEDLRERFYTQVQSASTGGNTADYIKWALSVTGIGAAKVFPLWNGPGSVKVVITDNEKQPAEEALVEAAAEYIEQVRPIGAAVTVEAAIAKKIDINAVVSLASGYTLQAVTTEFTESLKEYFKRIAFELTYVSLARIGTLLLGTDGITDYSNLQLNSGNLNVILEEKEIPVIGTVSLEV